MATGVFVQPGPDEAAGLPRRAATSAPGGTGLSAHVIELQVGMRGVGHVLVDHFESLFIDNVGRRVMGDGGKRGEDGGECYDLNGFLHGFGSFRLLRMAGAPASTVSAHSQ